MRIVVFSGTTEGRDFSRATAALGIAVTVSVATDLGAEEQGQAPGITVHSGRLLPGAMAELLQGAALCVDATHPYAVEATKNIRAAANAAGVEYHRLLRAASTLPVISTISFSNWSLSVWAMIDTSDPALLYSNALEKTSRMRAAYSSLV